MFIKTLFARFGLFAQKTEKPDAFALRLERMNMREARRQVRQALFHCLPQPLEGAAP